MREALARAGIEVKVVESGQARVTDAKDIRARSSEEAPADGPGQHAREVENADATEGQRPSGPFGLAVPRRLSIEERFACKRQPLRMGLPLRREAADLAIDGAAVEETEPTREIDLPALEAHLSAPHMTAYRERVKHVVVGVELQVLDPI